MLFPCYAQQAQDCITNAPGTACPNQDQTLPFEQQGLQIDQSFTLGGDAGDHVQPDHPDQRHHRGRSTTRTACAPTATPLRRTPTDPPASTRSTSAAIRSTSRTTTSTSSPCSIRRERAPALLPELDADRDRPRTYENHDTFPEGYTAVIPVMGGGTVLYHQSDRNCHAIDNCGIGSRSATLRGHRGPQHPQRAERRDSVDVPRHADGELQHPKWRRAAVPRAGHAPHRHRRSADPVDVAKPRRRKAGVLSLARSRRNRGTAPRSRRRGQDT